MDGAYKFNELTQMLQEKMASIEQMYRKSDLPDAPDRNRAEALLVQIRETFYGDK